MIRYRLSRRSRCWPSSFAARAGEAPKTTDALPALPFKEGDVIGYESIDKLKSYLPPPFWENREFFFYEGMQLEVGPVQRPYPVSPTYVEATARNGWKATIGADGALDNYTGGQPFDPKKIDCKGDPMAATKIIWNFKKSWNGSGGEANWFYSYWDRGEQLPLYYKGNAKGIMLARRAEKEFVPNGGDVFEAEKRLAGGRHHGRVARGRARDHHPLLHLQGRGRPARPRQELRHLGVDPEPAPHAPHLDRAAHRRGRRHRLHRRRPAQLQRRAAAVRLDSASASSA